MKKNSFIGYSIAIISGILLVCSALLSLTMTSSSGEIIQGSPLFSYLTITVGNQMLSLSIVFYIISIAFGLVNIICAIIGLIFTAKGTSSKVFLLVQRIVSLLSFLSIIISFIFLGIYLSRIESTEYNFMGFGILVAILATLLSIGGIFLVRAKEPTNIKEGN